MIRTVLRIIAGRVMPKIAYPVFRGPLKGLKFILGAASGNGGGASIHFGLVEPEQTNSFLKILKPGFVFFDIGANVGYYTLLASRLIGEKGKIFAFEPSTRNLIYLEKHIRINKLRNAMIIPAACSDEISLSLFEKTNDCALGHFVKTSDVQGNNIDLVPAITIDSVVQKTNTLPDVIKIDVEGAEMKVLQGCVSVLSQKHPVIFLSVHSDQLRDDCKSFLKQYNYEAIPLDTSENGEPYEFMFS